MQTERITFRASPLVAEHLIRSAERSGVSLSEYLRGIVREKVGLQ